MVNFVIAGKVSCPHFVQACYVAEYLEKHLPNFKLVKTPFGDDEWKEWITQKNKANNWHHITSPIIYKELLYYGGVPHLIGNLSDFWEYCSDYYGVETILPKEEIENLIKDSLEEYNRNRTEEGTEGKVARSILIYGATNPMIYILLPELLKIENLNMKRGIEVMLYDDRLTEEEDGIFKELISEMLHSFNCKVEMINNLGVGLKKCDLLIIIEDTSQLEIGTNLTSKCIIKTRYLSDEINNCAPESLRIVLANSGTSCLYATILMRCSKVKSSNIVVVSSDLGVGPLSIAAKEIDVPMEKLCAPPVWGFIGTNVIIDIGSALKKCNIYNPFERSVRTTDTSTLTIGTFNTELRFINYLTDDLKDIFVKAEKNRDSITEKTGRPPTYSKVDALVNMLKIWYRGPPSNEIISLGIPSDGSFGIPQGLVFSQPAILAKNGWVPFRNYPVPNHIKEEIKKAALEAASYVIDNDLLCKTNVATKQLSVSLHSSISQKSGSGYRSNSSSYRSNNPSIKQEDTSIKDCDSFVSPKIAPSHSFSSHKNTSETKY